MFVIASKTSNVGSPLRNQVIHLCSYICMYLNQWREMMCWTLRLQTRRQQHSVNKGHAVPSLSLPLVVLLLIYNLDCTHHMMLVDLGFGLNQGY
jgi:hypothetical protein